MKKRTKLISGLAASFLLAVGLHAAAEKLDPITKDSGIQVLADTRTENAQLSVPSCSPCQIDD